MGELHEIFVAATNNKAPAPATDLEGFVHENLAEEPHVITKLLVLQLNSIEKRFYVLGLFEFVRVFE